MSKKTILMVGPIATGNGGISKVIKGYYDSEIMNIFGIDYYSTYEGGTAVKKMCVYLCSFFKIAFNLRKYNCLHVHTASYWSFRRLSIILALGKIFSKKTIIHIHGGKFSTYYRNSVIFEKLFIKRIFKNADKVVVLSPSLRKKMCDICDPNKIEIIENTVSLVNNKDDYCKKNDENLTNIVFMGTVLKRKGVYDLIDAFEIVSKSIKEIKLYICGNGEINSVKQYIAEKNFEKNIILTGWVSGKEKESILRNGSVFILPSYIEAFPMSILEAMAYGLPVISTNIGGIPDIIVDSVDGFLIEPGDVKMLSERIKIIIEKKELWYKMSQNVKHKILKEYSYDITKKKIEILYKSLSK